MKFLKITQVQTVVLVMPIDPSQEDELETGKVTGEKLEEYRLEMQKDADAQLALLRKQGVNATVSIEPTLEVIEVD